MDSVKPMPDVPEDIFSNPDAYFGTEGDSSFDNEDYEAWDWVEEENKSSFTTQVEEQSNLQDDPKDDHTIDEVHSETEDDTETELKCKENLVAHLQQCYVKLERLIIVPGQHWETKSLVKSKEDDAKQKSAIQKSKPKPWLGESWLRRSARRQDKALQELLTEVDPNKDSSAASNDSKAVGKESEGHDTETECPNGQDGEEKDNSYQLEPNAQQEESESHESKLDSSDTKVGIHDNRIKSESTSADQTEKCEIKAGKKKDLTKQKRAKTVEDVASVQDTLEHLDLLNRSVEPLAQVDNNTQENIKTSMHIAKKLKPVVVIERIDIKKLAGEKLTDSKENVKTLNGWQNVSQCEEISKETQSGTSKWRSVSQEIETSNNHSQQISDGRDSDKKSNIFDLLSDTKSEKALNSETERENTFEKHGMLHNQDCMKAMIRKIKSMSFLKESKGLLGQQSGKVQWKEIGETKTEKQTTASHWLEIKGQNQHYNGDMDIKDNDNISNVQERSHSASTETQKGDTRKRRNSFQLRCDLRKKRRLTAARLVYKFGTFSRRMAAYRVERQREKCSGLAKMKNPWRKNVETDQSKPTQVALCIPRSQDHNSVSRNALDVLKSHPNEPHGKTCEAHKQTTVQVPAPEETLGKEKSIDNMQMDKGNCVLTALNESRTIVEPTVMHFSAEIVTGVKEMVKPVAASIPRTETEHDVLNQVKVKTEPSDAGYDHAISLNRKTVDIDITPSVKQVSGVGFENDALPHSESEQVVLNEVRVKTEPLDSGYDRSMSTSYCPVHGFVGDLETTVKKEPCDSMPGIVNDIAMGVEEEPSDLDKSLTNPSTRRNNTETFKVKTEPKDGTRILPDIPVLPHEHSSRSCVPFKSPSVAFSTIIKKESEYSQSSCLPRSGHLVIGEKSAENSTSIHDRTATSTQFGMQNQTKDVISEESEESVSLMSMLLCTDNSVRKACSGAPVIHNGLLYLHDDCPTSGAEDSDNESQKAISTTDLTDVNYINIVPVDDPEEGSAEINNHPIVPLAPTEFPFNTGKRNFEQRGQCQTIDATSLHNIVSGTTGNLQEDKEPPKNHCPIALQLYDLQGKLVDTYKGEVGKYIKAMLTDKEGDGTSNTSETSKKESNTTKHVGQSCSSEYIDVEGIGEVSEENVSESDLQKAWLSDNVDFDLTSEDDVCDSGDLILNVGIPGLGTVRCNVCVQDVDSEDGNAPLILGTWPKLAQLIKFFHSYASSGSSEGDEMLPNVAENSDNMASPDRISLSPGRASIPKSPIQSPFKSTRSRMFASIAQHEGEQPVSWDMTELGATEQYSSAPQTKDTTNIKSDGPLEETNKKPAAGKIHHVTRKVKKRNFTSKGTSFHKTMSAYKQYQRQFALKRGKSQAHKNRKMNTSVESALSTHEEEKAERHNISERIRRHAMCEDFASLKRVIPKLAGVEKASRILIISEAQKTIQELQMLEQWLREDLKCELERNVMLQLKLNQLRDGSNSAPMSFSEENVLMEERNCAVRASRLNGNNCLNEETTERRSEERKSAARVLNFSEHIFVKEETETEPEERNSAARFLSFSEGKSSDEESDTEPIIDVASVSDPMLAHLLQYN